MSGPGDVPARPVSYFAALFDRCGICTPPPVCMQCADLDPPYIGSQSYKAVVGAKQLHYEDRMHLRSIAPRYENKGLSTLVIHPLAWGHALDL